MVGHILSHALQYSSYIVITCKDSAGKPSDTFDIAEYKGLPLHDQPNM